MPFEPAHPNHINFGWLIRLRWWMIAGQLVAILGVRLAMGLALPLEALLMLIGLEAGLNVVAAVLLDRREAQQWWLAGIMAFDIVMCTGLLYLTGGPSNPFSFLYLVQIALAAITLRAAWTWALTALALLGSAVLFLWHRPLPANLSHAAHMSLHLRGMWVAFGVAAGFIVYFLLRVRRALEQREAELAASRRSAARQERLASLATLAAGAAHELSTPLTTIAVVMKELEHHLTATANLAVTDDETMKDIRLVREQIDRCRTILERMSSEAGTSVGEAFVPTSLEDIVAGAVTGLPTRADVRVELATGDRAKRLRLPTRAFSQALRGIVKNAQDATPDGGHVVIHVSARGSHVEFSVRDRGGGIAPIVLERIGEPFFTTKPAGLGMGLGVFLARAVVERLGGQIQLDSTVGVGTTAILKLPTRLLEGGAAAADEHLRVSAANLTNAADVG